jgi:hypothetical protein
MLLTKKLLHATIDDLPDEFTLDEIMQRIYLLHKIEKARIKSKQGKTYSTREARKKLSKWLK